MNPQVIHVNIPPSWQRKSQIRKEVTILSVTVAPLDLDYPSFQDLKARVLCDGAEYEVRGYIRHPENSKQALSVHRVWAGLNGRAPWVAKRSERRDSARVIAIKHAVEHQ